MKNFVVIGGAKQALFSSVVSNPKVDAVLIDWWWGASDCSALAAQIASLSGKPFLIRFIMLPVGIGAPTTLIGGQEIGVSWTTAYYNAFCWGVDNLFNFLAPDHGGQFLGIRFAYQTPYPGDGENGQEASSDGQRYDQAFADAGYTPSEFTAFNVQAIQYVAADPLMEGKIFSIALFTPGNHPHVNDQGQVSPPDDGFAIDNAMISALLESPCQNVLAFTTWDGSPLSPFWQSAANQATLIDQTKTGLSEANFQTAWASCTGPWRECHADQAQYL